ncbi:Rev3 DNA polymerase zeta, partial [Guillardia theta CCMP2712]
LRDTDPDILVGFEVQHASCGYLLERSAAIGFPLDRCLSRCPFHRSTLESRPDTYGQQQQSGIHVCGREILNVWRLCRQEIKLGLYNYTNVCAKVLNKRVPSFPPQLLHSWFQHLASPHSLKRQVLLYLLEKASNTLLILEAMELVGRTCELARVFGIDFFSVLSRGSQYRVESMLYRLARTQNFLLLSPSVQQRQSQPATECIPLVMEPQSAFYSSPVCVLDFRSLYPSVVIAYNMCYSTCLGKLVEPDSDGNVKLGVSSLRRAPGLLASVREEAIITPNGMAFLPPDKREGVLPRLLREILQARVAVKKLMKQVGGDVKLYRTLNSRQFGLKLIANVTYGYTSAGFSGRMPCADLADAIVQTGRETLERAIRTVEEGRQWGARVIYGDTDSLFVEIPGRSREEAFRIGREIAAAVTAENPAPMELELEKVYQPSMMVAKKRYVGYSYDSPSSKPVLDAKGIEMVRRDSCPLVMRVQEKALKVLFETKNISKLKSYMEGVFMDIIASNLNINEYVFAKEVRQGTYASSTLPPAATVNATKVLRDPRAGALHAERIPYVVVCGQPGARLVDLVLDPRELLASSGMLRINAQYYITKALIPCLERLLSLFGVDIRRWYLELPRYSRASSRDHASHEGSIRSHFQSMHCILCDQLSRTAVCAECTSLPQVALCTMQNRRGRVERDLARLCRICVSCVGSMRLVTGCDAVDCPVLYDRVKAQQLWEASSRIDWGVNFLEW